MVEEGPLSKERVLSTERQDSELVPKLCPGYWGIEEGWFHRIAKDHQFVSQHLLHFLGEKVSVISFH